MSLSPDDLHRLRQRHRGYRITLLVQAAMVLLMPLAQRLPGLLSLLICGLAVVLLVFTSRFSAGRRTRSLIFGLGAVAIAMEIFWQATLVLAPSLGRWLTFPHVLIWLLFLFTAVVRKVLNLTREPIVTTAVVLGAASGYLTLGVAGGILLTALWVLDPSSFNAALLPAVPPGHAPVLAVAPALMVSSFGLLTTVGSGLLSPASLNGQVAATSLAITGQLYVAILIGLILGRAQRRRA
ncbi:MAG: hypothetical protein ACKOZW_06800 [Cyanobium sp.]